MNTALGLIFGSLLVAYMIFVVYVVILSFKKSSFNFVIQGSKSSGIFVLNSVLGFIIFLLTIMFGALYIPVLIVQSLCRR
jgi:hypothetical protein